MEPGFLVQCSDGTLPRIVRTSADSAKSRFRIVVIKFIVSFYAGGRGVEPNVVVISALLPDLQSKYGMRLKSLDPESGRKIKRRKDGKTILERE